MALFKILKKFSDGNREFLPLEMVEIEGRNVEKLVSQRYLEPAPDSPADEKAEMKVSRRKNARAE